MSLNRTSLAAAAAVVALAGSLFPGCKSGEAARPEAAAKPAGAKGETAAAPEAETPNRFTKNGVTVEFALAGEAGDKRPLQEGDYAEIRFKVTDAGTGQPIRGITPAAWMDMGQVIEGQAGEQKECKDKVGLYLKGIVGIRPLVDLNAYYLLVMNQDASISVIDPVVSMTGNTSLYAQVFLKRPGEDWVKDRQGRRLFVSTPGAGEVAVLNTESFKLERSFPAGEAPTRVAVQPDGRYLWVGNDSSRPSESGVTVVDTEKLEIAGRIATGRGHHEIAFSADDRYAFITNRDEGTVSIVDVRKLRKVKDLKTGSLPISIAFSPLSQAAYVADGKDGTISVVDPSRLEVTARVEAKPGLGPLRFSQDGRWGFAVNTAENAVHVLDAAENRLIHTVPLPGKPYQVVFTRVFAYVRLIDSERVQMINLSSIGEGKKPTVQSFTAGAVAPKLAGQLSIADSISPANLEAAVFVVNPADSFTYYYMEGMNAPMGSFSGYGHRARAVGVVDRSLKELEPGVYGSKLRIPAAGKYDVAVLLDNPKLLHCFFVEAKENPALQKSLLALAVDYLDLPARAPARTVLPLRVKISEPRSKRVRTGLKDVSILYYRAPGLDRSQVFAREVGDGIYEAKVSLPVAGGYYLYVAAPSAGLKHADLPFRTVLATNEASVGAREASNAGEERGHVEKAP